MSDAMSELIIRYNRFMDLCQEFHNQVGSGDVVTRSQKLGEINQVFAQIAKMDEAAGNILEAKHYLGIAGELGRIARRFGA